MISDPLPTESRFYWSFTPSLILSGMLRNKSGWPYRYALPKPDWYQTVDQGTRAGDCFDTKP